MYQHLQRSPLHILIYLLAAFMFIVAWQIRDDIFPSVVVVIVAVTDRCQIFTTPRRPEELKNWKSEKLTAYPLEPDCQDFRFSGFQVFTPPSAARKSAEWARTGFAGAGNVLNEPNLGPV